jgi:sugar phosphate isomerase/epimerase
MAYAGTADAGGRKRLGLVLYSFAVRLAADKAGGPTASLNDPLVFLEHCHQLGAGGIQTPFGTRDRSYTSRLRAKAESYGLYLEGIIRLPRDRADLERFTAEARTAVEVGARVLRTTLLSGRRYEVFDSAAAFQAARAQALQSLAFAEPVVARHGLCLAVENHKDFRTDELTALLKRLDSRHVGVCVDTGNNLALLEDPHEVVEALAPWASTVHLKDMAVAECEDGFLLSEVPLGEGMLDLTQIVGTLRRAQPKIQFGLEMITRDPLRVPCLTPRYWKTLGTLPGRDLARTLALARRQKTGQLPRLSGLTRVQQLAAEDANVRKSLAYAAKHLQL